MKPEELRLFEREGHPLSDWLMAILSPETAISERAALMLMSMQVGVSDPNIDVTPEMLPADPEAHRAQFGAAVRAAVDAPEFPRCAYVETLMQFIEESQMSWMAQNRRDRQRFDRVADKIEARMLSDESSGKLERELRRLEKALCAQFSSKIAPRMGQAFIYAGIVFNQLDHALLEASDRLEHWLKTRGLSIHAREALKRIGPTAVRFAPQLLAELDAESSKEEAWWWGNVRVLAAVAQLDDATIRALMSRLDGPPAIAGNAAAVLGEIGLYALRVVPNLVDRLLKLTNHEVEFVRLASFGALGVLGAGRSDVGNRLVDAIKHGTNYEPGYAISALSPAVLPAEIAVPLLIELLDTFEEFDCDREEHERITGTLAHYGKDAAPATAKLCKLLWWGEELHEPIVRCLGAIGPAARDATPALVNAAKLVGIEDLVVDKTCIGQTWRAITGEH
jgi:hypothetical protein